MIRWLTKYVQRIDLTAGGLTVGIDLRDRPPEPQSLPQSPAPARNYSPLVETRVAASTGPASTLIRVVTGTSWSKRSVPRELDLMLEGEEIQFHIHQRDGSQRKYWVRCGDLQGSINQWNESGRSANPVIISGRTARKSANVALVFLDDGEVEVRAGWWMRVPIEDFRVAMNELGVTVP